MDRNTGKSRGFGYVHFTTAEAAQKALTLDGKEIDGRPIRVDLSTPFDKNKAQENRAKAFGDKISEPSATLYVGNLSYRTVEDTLYEVFGDYGDVKAVRLPTDRETGEAKGFGYVEFNDVKSAKQAFEAMNGKDIDGRPVRLDYNKPKQGANAGFSAGGRVTIITGLFRTIEFIFFFLGSRRFWGSRPWFRRPRARWLRVSCSPWPR